MSTPLPSMEEIQALQKLFSENGFIDEISWNNNKLQVDVLGERISLTFQPNGTPIVSGRFDQAETVINRLTQFIRTSKPSLAELIDQIVEEMQRALNLPITKKADPSEQNRQQQQQQSQQQEQSQLSFSQQTEEEIVLTTELDDDARCFSISSETNPKLKAEVRQAQNRFGLQDIQLIQNTVYLHLDTNFLDDDMCQVLGINRTSITISLEFSSEFEKEPLLPKMNVFQTQNPHFFAATQIKQILRNFITDVWLSYRDPNYAPKHTQIPPSGAVSPSVGSSAGSTSTTFSSRSDPLPRRSPQQRPPKQSILHPVPHKYEDLVETLLPMGFSRRLAEQALTISEGDMEMALDILITNQSILQTTTNPEQDVILNDHFYDGDSNNNPVIDLEQSPPHNSSSSSSSCDGGSDFIVQIVDYMRHRLTSLTNHCVICDRPHAEGFFGVKPVPCENPDCHFRFQELGLGANVMFELKNHPKMVDLLISMASSAASSQRANLLVDPFPTDFFDLDGQKRFENLHRELNLLPPIVEMTCCEDEKELRDKLGQISPYSYRLLRWIMTTNRALLIELQPARHLKAMETAHQFRMASSPPEKEAKFVKLRKSNGSFYAFHGSPFENWHSILRKGLKNCSGTQFQLHGAAMGKGIYLASNSGTSVCYSQPGNGWKNSIFGTSVTCIALCEISASGKGASNRGYGDSVHVIPDEDAVCARYFFVYSGSELPFVEASAVIKPAAVS